MRKLTLLLAVTTAAVLAPAAAHAYCYGVSSWTGVPTQHVCGTISNFGYNGSQHVWKTAGTTNVKLCPQGASSNSGSCRIVSTVRYLDGWNRPVEAFLFYNFRQGATGYNSFDIYLWSSYDYWGSSTSPQGWISLGPNGLEGISWAVVPRPLKPTPVYPTGSSVPSSYTVRWKSGKDIDRQPYATTYEVWFKYWPFGGTEPASWSLSAANLPCHSNGSGPDINNECSTYVSGPQPAGNWRWYVVANANAGSVVSYPNTIYTTQSDPVSFVQPF